MTVQAQNSVQYYNGPIEIGTELSIVEFTFIDNSHVSAKVRGNTEVWQYGHDYIVSGAQTLIRTITVQRRVAENEVLAVYLDVPITQNISPEEGGNFPASTNEYVLDKLTHISQMLDERIKRSLQISIDTPFSGTLPAPEPNKALKISSDGNSFVMSDYDPDLALVLTENFKNQAQQAAVEAENQKNVAIQQVTLATQQANIATQQANIATEKKAEVVESGMTAVQNIDTAFNTANEWFTRLNAIPYIQVGTILPTTGAIDESLGYQRYANGQLITGASTVAPDLITFLEYQETHAPNLLCSEIEWQTALTLSTLGQVGKYVWNKEEDSIRIPRIVNIQGMMDMNTVGNMVEAGLPNITASVTGASNCTRFMYPEGAFQVSGNTTYDVGTGNGSAYSNLHLNASELNPIYGNSNTVQEESILYPYVLQIATGVQYKTPVINEIELNNPFSLLDYKFSEYELNNLSWLRSEGQYNSKAVYPAVYDLLLKIYNGTETKAGVSVKLSTETFTDYDFVLNTADETFRLPIKVKANYFESIAPVAGNGMTLGLTNGTKNAGLYSCAVYNEAIVRLMASPSRYGYNVSETYTDIFDYAEGDIGVTTDSTKSGLEAKLTNVDLYLYFYVGETVQNANLINAGRFSEEFAGLVEVGGSISMPSSKYIDLNLGASGSEYTAPADGWVFLSCLAGTSLQLYNLSKMGIFATENNETNRALGIYIPVSKGDVFKQYYTMTTGRWFRFYYAEGSKWEAY